MQLQSYAAHFPSLWESEVAEVWTSVTRWSVRPSHQNSGQMSVKETSRGSRETEVVSGKQGEVSLSGQFQFQSDLITYLKVAVVTDLRYHMNMTSYRTWFDTDNRLLRMKVLEMFSLIHLKWI